MEWIKFVISVFFGAVGYVWLIRQIRSEVRNIGELTDSRLQIIRDRIRYLESKIDSVNHDDSCVEEWEEEDEDRSWDDDVDVVSGYD